MFDTSETTQISLRTLFLRRQIFAFCTVLCGVTVLLLIYTYSALLFMNEKRMVDWAISFENQTQTIANQRFYQHVVTNAIHSGVADGIIVFDNYGDELVAAAATTKQSTGSSWLLNDPKVRAAVKQASRTGVFGFHHRGDNGRIFAVLPFKRRALPTNKRLVLIDEMWPTPRWHKIASKQTQSIEQIGKRFVAMFSNDTTRSFQLRPVDYDGVIAMEANKDWFSTVLVRSLVLLVVLLGGGFLFVQLFLNNVLKTKVLKPLRQFSEVIASRREGALDARAPIVGIRDFDKLAGQWNSLLDYREVAQSQNIVLSTLLEHVPVGIQVSDHESKVEYANPAFLKMSGLRLVDIIGKSPDETAAPFSIPQEDFGDVLVQLTEGENWSGEVENNRPDGKTVTCTLTIVPVFDQLGQVERIVTLHHDISDMKDKEKTLVAAKLRAEMADKAKSEFIANMSHELRTPLNAIIGFSEMMAEEKFGALGQPEYREFSQLIEKSSRALLASINSILDLSRLDSDKVNLRESRVSVSQAIVQLKRLKEEKAKNLGVSITTEIADDAWVKTDENHLHQSLGFLVCNAIRYNKQGGDVKIKSFMRDGELVIAVKDTGIGIPADQVSEVTKPFHRVDNSHDRHADGVGLGLTLVQRYAQAHQIVMNITSVEGEGTSVELVFPKERVLGPKRQSSADTESKLAAAV